MHKRKLLELRWLDAPLERRLLVTQQALDRATLARREAEAEDREEREVQRLVAMLGERVRK